ncbi:unnamed protein product [Parajaminaea phylloscopi]
MAQEPLTPFGDALAGALGASFANIATYPLDVSKTRIQAGKLSHEISVRGSDGQVRKVKVNPGLFTGVGSIAARDGVRSLYSGVGASTVNTLSMQFSYFFFYSYIRSFWLKRMEQKAGPGVKVVIGTAMELVLGALAGAVAQVFTIPVSVIATRQQLASRESPTGDVSSLDARPSGATTVSGKPAGAGEEKQGALSQVTSKAVGKLTEDNSFMGVARDILREDGVAGLWRGLKASLVLTVNPAITYGVFERVKSLILASTADGKMTPWRSFFIGALSKSLATVVTFPYILAKVRLQGRVAGSEAGAIGMLVRVLQKEGLTGWYQGMQAQIIKAVLTQSILFVARDYVGDLVRVLMNGRRSGSLGAAAKA